MAGNKKAAKKRPAGGQEDGAPAEQQPGEPEQQDPVDELHTLEGKRKDIGGQLQEVERRIYDLETKYLENCNQQGNALKGYDALLTQPQGVQSKYANTVRNEDRLFSGSSVTGTVHLGPR